MECVFAKAQYYNAVIKMEVVALPSAKSCGDLPCRGSVALGSLA